MADVFLYGVLLHEAVRRAVIGRALALEAAHLADARAVAAQGGALCGLAPGAGAVGGGVARGMTPEEVARISFFAGGQDCERRAVTLADGRGVAALVWPGAAVDDAADWHYDVWLDRWGDTVAAAARDCMDQFGRRGAAETAARWPMMLIRGGARVRAGAAGPMALRRGNAAGDVDETVRRQPYAAYFAVEEYDLRFRRFDGRMSEVMTRAVFISGDAAVVLPYDPVRDRVLVIEQWRAGPHARGDGQPWLIEAVAGRVDGGESPENAARREAREEAGVDLRDLIPAAHYYPSPAAKGEYLYTYVGIADLPDSAAGIGGLPGEGEDIRAHVIPFDRLMALVASGEVNNAPLILLAYWLDRERPRLRAAASGGASGAGG